MNQKKKSCHTCTRVISWIGTPFGRVGCWGKGERMRVCYVTTLHYVWTFHNIKEEVNKECQFLIPWSRTNLAMERQIQNTIVTTHPNQHPTYKRSKWKGDYSKRALSKEPYQIQNSLSQHIKTKIKHRNQITKDQNERTTFQKEPFSMKS